MCLCFLERVPSQPKIELQTDPCHLGVTVESGFAGLVSIDARWKDLSDPMKVFQAVDKFHRFATSFAPSCPHQKNTLTAGCLDPKDPSPPNEVAHPGCWTVHATRNTSGKMPEGASDKLDRKKLYCSLWTYTLGSPWIYKFNKFMQRSGTEMAALRDRHAKPLFCQPSNVALTIVDQHNSTSSILHDCSNVLQGSRWHWTHAPVVEVIKSHATILGRDSLLILKTGWLAKSNLNKLLPAYGGGTWACNLESSLIPASTRVLKQYIHCPALNAEYSFEVWGKAACIYIYIYTYNIYYMY